MDKGDKPDYIDYKDVQPVRRDTPKLKTTIQECIDLIIVKNDRVSAFALLKNTFSASKAETIRSGSSARPVPSLIESECPPAAEVALHLRERGLPVPDRVEYVYVIGDPRVKASKKVETPEFVMSNPDYRVDVRYYMTNQFRKPVLELLGPALDGLGALVDTYTEKCKHVTLPWEKQYRLLAHQNEIKTPPITTWFRPPS